MNAYGCLIVAPDSISVSRFDLQAECSCRNVGEIDAVLCGVQPAAVYALKHIGILYRLVLVEVDGCE